MATIENEAKGVAARLVAASSLCDEAIRVVKLNEGLGELKAFADLASAFLGHSYTNLLAPIWAEHPALEPAEMREEYEPRKPTLSPASREAVEAFIAEARAALSLARSAVASNAISRPLPFGGLQEVADSLKDVERFWTIRTFR